MDKVVNQTKNDMCLTPWALAVNSPKGQLILVLSVKEKCQHKPALQQWYKQHLKSMGFLWEAPQNSNILISLHNLRITLVAENTYCLFCISNILNNISQTQVHIKEGRLTPKLCVISYFQVFYWHLIGTSLLICGNHLGICEDPNQGAKIITGGKIFN